MKNINQRIPYMTLSFTFNFLLFSLTFIPSSVLFSQTLSCGIDDSKIPEDIKKIMSSLNSGSKSRLKNDQLYICNLAIGIDSQTFEEFGNDSVKILNEVAKQIEDASKITEKDLSIKLYLKKLYIWKEKKSDPFFNISNIFEAINILHSQSSLLSSDIDVVMYLPTKPLTGAGGLAWAIGSQHNISPFGNIHTILHELGHNLGSIHTHNCNWPGGPIDYCYPLEGNCYSESLEVDFGSIMSYCSLPQKEYFHPLCIEVIQEYSFKKLRKVSNKPQSPVLPALLQNEKTFVIGPLVIDAESYYYQISTSPNFQTILFSDTVETNTLNMNVTQRGKEYYIREKALNRFGASGWSNVLKVGNLSSFLNIPKPLSPFEFEKTGNPEKDIKLEFEPVEGATSYEIEVTNSFDINFTYAKRISVSGTNSKIINLIKLGLTSMNIMLWRVRAKNNFNISEWSKIMKFLPQPYFPIQVPFYNFGNAPTKFPINIDLIYDCDVRLLISESADFKNPVIDMYQSKLNRALNEGCTFFLEKLKTQTKYYIQVQYSNPAINNDPFLPPGTFHTVGQTLQTKATENIEYELYLHNNNLKELNSFINVVFPIKNSLVFTNNKSISFLSLDGDSLAKFDRTNTKGGIGFNYYSSAIDIDDQLNLYKIVQLGKIKEYIGAFPKPIYALRKYNSETMEVISSQEFSSDSGSPLVSNVDPYNNIIGDGNRVWIIRNEKAVLIDIIPPNATIVCSKPNLVWFKVQNNTQGNAELYLFDVSKNQVFKIPQPIENANYQPSIFKVDTFGNLWATISSNALGMFDGISWTIYNKTNSPFKDYIHYFDFNRSGVLYVLSYSNNTNSNLHSFSFNRWSLAMNDIEMVANFKFDSQNNLWFFPLNTALLKIDNCLLTPRPNFKSELLTVAPDQNIKIEASSCTNVLWSWSNLTNSNVQSKTVGGNTLELFITSDTKIKAICFNESCTSLEDSVEIKILPKIELANGLLNNICIFEELKIKPKIRGSFGSNNTFYANFKKDNINYKFPLESKEGVLFLRSGAFNFSGKYEVTISSTFPVVISDDTLHVNLYSAPSTELLGTSFMCGDIKKTLNTTVIKGKEPYKFLWYKDSVLIENSNNPSLTVDSPGLYTFNVLDENICISKEKSILMERFDFPKILDSQQSSEYLLLNTPVTLSFSTDKVYEIEWWKNNKIILGANDTSLVVNESGTYMAKVNNNGCNIFSQEFSVMLVLDNGINNSNIEFKVSPNPSNDLITVLMDSKDMLSGELNLIDSKGSVLHQKVINKENSFTRIFDLGSYPSGVYFINFKADGLSKSYRVVKN